MTAISEAAERRDRLRRVKAGEPKTSVYPYTSDNETINRGHAEGCHWRDIEASAERDLAEHPADENEPVTEDWLRSVGFRASPDFEFLFMEAGLRPGTIEFDPDIGWIIFGSKATRLLETRGQLRRLCAALGIELKAA